jgi:hypothetical protein
MFKRKGAEPLDHLDFCKTARSFGIDGVEYVNQMFFDKAEDKAYLAEMKKRQDDEGVKGLLIMVDREGNLGESDEAKRTTAVSNHLKWLDAAASLGCHSLRVNAASNAKLTYDEQMKLAADGLHRLCLEADKRNLFVVVENHGGLSSNGYGGRCFWDDSTFTLLGLALLQPALAEAMRLHRSHGITSKPEAMEPRPSDEIWNYQQVSLGFNYRMTDIAAALGIAQIKGVKALRDIGARADVPPPAGTLFDVLAVPPHGARFLRLTPT